MPRSPKSPPRGDSHCAAVAVGCTVPTPTARPPFAERTLASPVMAGAAVPPGAPSVSCSESPDAARIFPGTTAGAAASVWLSGRAGASVPTTVPPMARKACVRTETMATAGKPVDVTCIG